MPSLGGARPGNCSRDFKTEFSGRKSKMVLPNLHDVPTLIYNSSTKDLIPSTIAVLFPHIFLGWTFKYYPEQFQLRFKGPGPNDLSNFWNSMKPDDENVWKHAMLDHSDLANSVPYVCYGDGVPAHRSWSLNCYGTKSLVGIGKSIDTMALYTGVPNCLLAPDKQQAQCTTAPLWVNYAWSWEWIAQNQWPPVDSMLRPWPKVANIPFRNGIESNGP